MMFGWVILLKNDQGIDGIKGIKRNDMLFHFCQYEECLARNYLLFEKKGIPTFQVAHQIKPLAPSYKMLIFQKRDR
jgi:hypothetical protein